MVFLLVVSFLLYSLLVVWYPGGPYSQYQAAMKAKTTPGSNDGLGNDRYLGPGIEQMAKEYYKVDRSWPVSYFLWLFDPQDTRLNEQAQEVPNGIDWNIGPLHITGSGMLTGDFGRSTIFGHGAPVRDVIGPRLGRTAWLVLASLLISVFLAIPLGVLGAVRRNSLLDHILTMVSFAALSLPTFLLGLMLIIFMSVAPYLWHNNNGWTWLPYLPPGDANSLNGEGNLLDFIYHLVLPATALAAVQIATISRYVRFSLIDVMGEDYIRTAFAKGAGMRRVVFKHALKNALLPLITTVALALPGILSGLILVESIFNYPGIGGLFLRTVGGTFTGMLNPDLPSNGSVPINMDVPVALILFLLMISAVAAANTVADLLYAASDPRVSFGSGRKR